jgi:purine-binding chemotaxis protein CheW
MNTLLDNSSGAEFLAFKMGNEEYGLDILRVQEIRGYEAVTRIANAPPCFKGVVNLRGVIVPIIDLRIRFNLARRPTTNSRSSSCSTSAGASWASWSTASRT